MCGHVETRHDLFGKAARLAPVEQSPDRSSPCRMRAGSETAFSRQAHVGGRGMAQPFPRAHRAGRAMRRSLGASAPKPPSPSVDCTGAVGSSPERGGQKLVLPVPQPRRWPSTSPGRPPARWRGKGVPKGEAGRDRQSATCSRTSARVMGHRARARSATCPPSAPLIFAPVTSRGVHSPTFLPSLRMVAASAKRPILFQACGPEYRGFARPLGGKACAACEYRISTSCGSARWVGSFHDQQLRVLQTGSG